MKNPATITIFGPTNDGYSVLADFCSGHCAARPKTTDLLPAIDWLKAAVKACVDAGADWDLRGEDEKRPLLQTLRKAGMNILTTFAQGEHESEIREMLGKAQILRPHTDDHLPWEFIYLGDEDGPVEMDRFLGAHAAVGRPFERGSHTGANGSSGLSPHSPWDAEPKGGKTPFGLAQDGRLPSARNGAERSIFSRQGVEVSPLAPLANTPVGWDTFKRFLEMSTVLTHFNSHADDDVPGLQGAPTSALFISDSFVIDIERINRLPLREASIVFLNCCNAISLRFNRRQSLADAFAKRRIAAVVAPTERVGDTYATQWAEQFYIALTAGGTVVDSILHARRTMLARDGNPMALLYGFLGAADARLPTEVPVAAEAA